MFLFSKIFILCGKKPDLFVKWNKIIFCKSVMKTFHLINWNYFNFNAKPGYFSKLITNVKEKIIKNYYLLFFLFFFFFIQWCQSAPSNFVLTYLHFRKKNHLMGKFLTPLQLNEYRGWQSANPFFLFPYASLQQEQQAGTKSSDAFASWGLVTASYWAMMP